MTTPFDTQSFSIGFDDEQNAADILSDGLTFNWTSADAAILSNLSAMIFSNNTNASGVFDDIVACMTDSLRHSTNSTIAKGHTLRPVALIQVSWIWIILPLSLALLSAVFLGWTLWYNSHYRAPLWKSGLLPLLFHGLEGFDDADLSVERRRLINEVERDMRIRLTANENGVTKFLKSDFEG
ncbi:hypothetical protein BFW01_g4879 [Lasiodiplodia theobromae]|nr:hypothetical protein BFW01_g4879 [Lasiodiplodia theobromae]